MLVRQPRIQDSSACSDTCRVTDGGEWGVNELKPTLPRTQKSLPVACVWSFTFFLRWVNTTYIQMLNSTGGFGR